MKIALIGCGKMGTALLNGWLRNYTADTIYVLEPNGIPQDISDEKIKTYKTSGDFLKDSPRPDVIVLAIKPQVMDAACSSIKSVVSPDTLILSIAAGQTVASFEKRFGAEQPIVRAMPNTPASIGKGITVAIANEHITQTHAEQAERILTALGHMQWAEDERIMNAVTALSGSGPAYVFLLIEALAKAGEKCGLETEFAMNLARQTVIGSAALAEIEDEAPASVLRQNVTSPGGTTEAALKILMADDGIQRLFDRALDAATKRGKELSS